jgi:hypothetical protein
VLAASRAHLEWYRIAMEQRGLAPRRLTVGRAPSVATTGSPTSTAASPAIRPSTYDRRRQNLDRHAANVVVAFVTSG